LVKRKKIGIVLTRARKCTSKREKLRENHKLLKRKRKPEREREREKEIGSKRQRKGVS